MVNSQAAFFMHNSQCILHNGMIEARNKSGTFFNANLVQ